MWKRVALSAAGVILLLCVGGLLYAAPTIGKFGGLAANITCNKIYSSGLDPQFVTSDEVVGSLGIPGLGARVSDAKAQRVEVTLLGIAIGSSQYSSGYGCAQEQRDAVNLPAHIATQSEGGISFGENHAAFPLLNKLIVAEFAAQETDPDHPSTDHHGVLVVHKGEIIAEHYAAPYDADSGMDSMSMAKSINAFLWAIADERGFAQMDDPAFAPEWAGKADPRAMITNRHLLNMVSGLSFKEQYEPGEDGLGMLISRNMAGYVAQYAQEAPPGTRFYYSSGDTNLASRSLHHALAKRDLTIARFAEDSLFDPIGADSPELLTDETGVFIGSSFATATLQDWARLGQLLLQDGQVAGRPVLPPSYIDALATPLDLSQEKYRLGIWFNRSLEQAKVPVFPGWPEDTIAFRGVGMKLVLIVPSEDLIVVRTGNSSPKAVRYTEKFLLSTFEAFRREKAVEKG